MPLYQTSGLSFYKLLHEYRTLRTFDTGFWACNSGPSQADTDVRRVACQAPAAPGCLVLERKPEREDEHHPQGDKRLAVSQQLNVVDLAT